MAKSINSEIISVLEAAAGLKVYEDDFNRPDPEYITFSISDDRAELYGDDEPQEDVIRVTVHLFVKRETNYLSLKKTIRQALHNADFTWPIVTTLQEPNCWHIVFETETINNYDI